MRHVESDSEEPPELETPYDFRKRELKKETKDEGRGAVGASRGIFREGGRNIIENANARPPTGGRRNIHINQ